MSPPTDVSREAMDGLADAILERPIGDGDRDREDPTPAPPVDEEADEHVDGLATVCLQMWADGEASARAS